MEERLQKILSRCGLCSRRTAEEWIGQGRVTVNGKPAKASYQVKVGDVLELAFGARTLKVQVLQTPEHVGKNEAGLLYQEIE